jgi:WbqC-like protein family
MILGVMQPYFVPYLEHFRLIAACDRWIVFDTVAFRRKTWMSRNRVLNRDKEGIYISAPVVRGATQGPVADAALSPTDWQADLRGRLRVYANEAPFYEQTCELVDRLIDPDHTTLADLNTWSLREICRHLEIETPIDRLSEMNIELPKAAGAGEWALLISQALGATEYRNPSGGKDIFDPAKFEAAAIRLSFHQHRTTSYDTDGLEYVPDLSVLDPLMWVGRDQVRQWVLPS